MIKNKDKIVDIEVHMSTAYTRKKENSFKRKFSLVVGGLLLTSSLLGCVNENVIAAPEVIQPTKVESLTDQVASNVLKVEDSQQMIKNLELFVKVVEER